MPLSDRHSITLKWGTKNDTNMYRKTNTKNTWAKKKYDHNKVMELVNSGVSRNDIIEDMGIARSTLLRIIKKNGGTK